MARPELSCSDDGTSLRGVRFGGGPRLFADIGRDVGVELVETIASPRVTHARYAVHTP